MPVYYNLKPEAALKNAADMMKIGKNESALECLAELMRSRRFKVLQGASNKVLEDVMRLISKLCVEMRNNITFKEVVHQYKNMIASTNPKSLEDIVSEYLNDAKLKTDQARNEARVLVTDVEDLETIETPESLMMRSVSMEGAQDRSDRTILAPWLKFLWESYRLVLELLRNNKKFEKLYHQVAQEVFRMCIDYNRKAEFRKLCDLLRKDLSKVQSQINQVNLPNYAISLSNPETQVMHLETKLQQLDCAFTLEQFSEAYKTIENIWSLITMNVKMAKPKFMADYYMKLAEIFYRCDTMLFHAATLLKHFVHSRELKKAMGQEELHCLASRVYCAILAIPLPTQREHNVEYSLENNEVIPLNKQKILSNIIGLASPPTRLSLLKDLVRLNIHHQANPELTKLYQYLEVDFFPLHLNKRVSPLLEFVSEQPTLRPYLKGLQRVVMSRTLLQCSQVYQCMRLDKFVDLVSVSHRLKHNIDNSEDGLQLNALSKRSELDLSDENFSLFVERSIVSIIYQLELPVRLDLRDQTIRFQVYYDLGIGSHQLDASRSSSYRLMGDANKRAGQDESLCGQLVGLCVALHDVVQEIQPMELEPERVQAISHSAQCFRQTEKSHHERLLERKNLIEQRKVKQEVRFKEQTLQERKYVDEMNLRLQKEESERLKNEAQLREQRRAEEREQELMEKMRNDRLKLIRSREMGNRALQGVTEEQLSQMQPEEFLNLEFQEVKRQHREKVERLRTTERRLDHFTRALRQEELPLLQAEAKASPEIALKRYEEAYQEKLEKARIEHETQINDKERLMKLTPYISRVLDWIATETDREYQAAQTKWQEECNEERLRLLQLRKEQRKEERKQAYIKRKQEEHVRALEEQKRIAREKAEIEAATKETRQQRIVASDNIPPASDTYQPGGFARKKQLEGATTTPSTRDVPRNNPFGKAVPVNTGPNSRSSFNMKSENTPGSTTESWRARQPAEPDSQSSNQKVPSSNEPWARGKSLATTNTPSKAVPNKETPQNAGVYVPPSRRQQANQQQTQPQPDSDSSWTQVSRKK